MPKEIFLRHFLKINHGYETGGPVNDLFGSSI